MTTQGFIRTVGNESQYTPLNYRNKVLHSLTTRFARDESDSGLSIKYVVQGEERFKIGQQWHRITDGRFLVVNEHQSFLCRVEAPRPVEGLCIYLDPATAYSISYSMQAGHDRLLEEGADFETPDQVYFLEKIYGLCENSLGCFLQSVVPMLRDAEGRAQLDGETFFLRLAEELAKTQVEVDLLLGRLAHERKATREEIFRRISIARQYIDAHYLKDLCLDELSSAAAFSKYHFLRCFKQVYGLSPYQYVLKLRLENACSQLRLGRRSLSEIAEETGFGDRRAFNKAFRKAYGINPMEYRASS